MIKRLPSGQTAAEGQLGFLPLGDPSKRRVTRLIMWEIHLEAWRQWLVAAGRPETTIRLRLYQMRRFAEHNPDPWEQTQPSIIQWLAGQSWSIESRRSYRSALRGFYGWAHASGLMDHDPARLLPPIKPAKHGARPTPEDVLRVALATADDRTTLMILLAARQGLRRGEIARIHSDDLVRDLSGWSLNVLGKGGKHRLIPLNDEIARRLRLLPAGWAFPGQIDGHLSAVWVGTKIRNALAPGWSAHTLRHRFATVAYRGSRDLLAVQELLGHAKPETTQQYVRLPDDALRAAMRWAA